MPAAVTPSGMARMLSQVSRFSSETTSLRKSFLRLFQFLADLGLFLAEILQLGLLLRREDEALVLVLLLLLQFAQALLGCLQALLQLVNLGLAPAPPPPPPSS